MNKIKYLCIKDGRLYVATEYQEYPPLTGFLELALERLGCTDIQHKMECKYQGEPQLELYRYVIHGKVPDRWPKEADVEIFAPGPAVGTLTVVITQRNTEGESHDEK